MTSRTTASWRAHLAALSVLACAPVGCGADDGDDACAQADAPTYGNFGARFVADYCQGCHASSVMGAARKGAPEAYKFDTLVLIQSRADDMRDAVVETMTMPFGSTSPKPSAAERARFGQWLDCGARE